MALERCRLDRSIPYRRTLPHKEIATLATQRTWRLTVVPGPDGTGDWDDYVGGLTGLRTAAAKHPDAWHACSAAPWWDTVDRLLWSEVDSVLSRMDWVRQGSPWSAGGAAVVRLNRLGVRRCYGDQAGGEPVDLVAA
ncbi:hypothetical protein [Streptomyces sp. SM12]|uniref:hypothetical protein n=1 Tax=Streptomyces sp. SM12 TaxID=1071602 RepID=UPI0011B0920F|nr:hypothetical protein [Streptomyces sp. SM12]